MLLFKNDQNLQNTKQCAMACFFQEASTTTKLLISKTKHVWFWCIRCWKWKERRLKFMRKKRKNAIDGPRKAFLGLNWPRIGLKVSKPKFIKIGLSTWQAYQPKWQAYQPKSLQKASLKAFPTLGSCVKCVNVCSSDLSEKDK